LKLFYIILFEKQTLHTLLEYGVSVFRDLKRFYLFFALTVIFLGLAASVLGIVNSKTPFDTSALALSH